MEMSYNVEKHITTALQQMKYQRQLQIDPFKGWKAPVRKQSQL